MDIELMIDHQWSHNLNYSEIYTLTRLQNQAEKDGREYLAQFEEDQQQGQ